MIRSLLWLASYLVLTCATVSADTREPRFAYGVNGEDFSLSTYRVDEEGRLRHLGHRPIDKSPTRVVLDPSGKFLLAVSNTTDNLMVFRLNTVSGDLQPVPGSPFATGGRSPFSIQFHPSGRFVYLGVRFGGVGAFTFNQDTGVIKPIPGSVFPAQRRTREVIIHPSGRYLYASNAYSNSVSAYTINQETGALSEMAESPYSVGDFGNIDYPSLFMGDVPAEAGGIPISIDTDPEGRFVFVANKAGASVSMFAVNPDDGSLNSVKGSPFFTGFNPYRLKVHPSGKFLYVTLWDSGQVSVQTIDYQMGALHEIKGSPFSVGSDTPVDIAFNSDGTQAYISNYDGNDISLMNVNTENGTLALKEIVKTRLGPWSLQLVDGEKAESVGETLFFAAQESGVGRLGIVNEKVTAVDDGMALKSSGVVVEPNGRFLYAINKDESMLATYVIDRETDGLTAVNGGLVKTGKTPTDITIDVNGWYLYVTNSGDDSMSVYFLNPETGIPEEVRGSPFATGKTPVSIVQDAAARYIFVLNRVSEDISVYRYVNNVSPLIFESRKYGSPFKAGKAPAALIVDPTGRYVYVANKGSNTISAFLVHRKTGALSAIPGAPFKSGAKPMALAVHPDGHFLYVANEGSGDITMFQIETKTGVLKSTGRAIKTEFTPKALWIDGQGERMFVLGVDGKQLSNYRIDKNNGLLSLTSTYRSSSAINDLWLMERPGLK